MARGSKNSADEVEARQNEVRAVQLRRDHFTYQQIADAVGCDKGTAYRRVQRGLDLVRADLKAEAESLLALELERLDRWQRKIDKKVAKGDLAAIQTALRISQHRAKLLGLEKPTVHKLEDPEGHLARLLPGIFRGSE